jgi:2,3,4,5-tetrahydropyridine-2-carboxylate N-succinyltransferase
LTSARATGDKSNRAIPKEPLAMPSHAELAAVIDRAWETRAGISAGTKGEVRDAVDTALGLLDTGAARVAEKTGGDWVVHQWLKKAVLLSFRLQDSEAIAFGRAKTDGDRVGTWGWDKVPLKFSGRSKRPLSMFDTSPFEREWDDEAFREAGFRVVPGAIVRRSAFIGRNVVLMPSFVNVGAYVDSGTMVDTWATVGSCAQIGRNVHLSGGVGIGGVLEPMQASPTIIEDNCFIGARSEVVEGVIVGEGSVLAMGVFISATTKIVDRATGAVHIGRVPPFSVVVSGSLPGKAFPDGSPGPSLYCAVIVKTVDAQTRSKTSINDLLRD